MTESQLLERVEDFLAAHRMSPSRFGREAMGDAALVFQLRDGKRSLSMKNAEKLVDFMSAYPSEQAAAA